jgi:hypothetical protein
MSYRKIEVLNTIYEYTIGRSYTKIRGIGAFRNDTVGEKVFIDCGCNSGKDCNSGEYKISVTPKAIKDFIFQLKSTKKI